MKSPTTDLARYFIAIIPPSPIFEEALALKNYFKEKYESKASINSPPHITLQPPFHWGEKNENELSEGLVHFAEGRTSMTISLSDFGAYAPRVIFISVEENQELKEFQHELKKYCTEQLHLPKTSGEDRKFHPHLTLAFRDLKKQEFNFAWEEFKVKKFSASFKIEGFDLLKHDGTTWGSRRHFRF
jgi:2'-5' RNA ligase